MLRPYEPGEERPRHPVTGQPADHYWLTEAGKRIARWKKPKRHPADFIAHAEDRWYSTREAGQVMGRHPRVIAGYVRSGALPASQPVPRGRYLIKGADLIAFVSKRTRASGEAA